MSLMSSIFGAEAGSSAPSSAASAGKADGGGLFESKLSVPAVLHKPAPSAKKGKGDENAAADGGESSAPTDVDGGDAQAQEESGATKKKTEEELKEEESRTVFVGNLPPDISRRALAAIFKPCGSVVSARLRSMAVAGVKLPPDQAGNQVRRKEWLLYAQSGRMHLHANMMRKVCANTGKLTDTPKKTAQGYVLFESIDSIEKALQLNGTAYESHTIRVDHASPTIESSKSVFVGNLPYGADEETLRDHFLDSISNEEDLNEREGCAVAGVRIIREKDTQKCKGFGYVILRDATLVPLALQLHGSTYMKRELRVMICGKRFKGNRGDESAAGVKSGRRSFEGQRATGPVSSAKKGQKRKAEDGGPSGGGGGGKAKKRRARSEKKSNAPGAKSGMSKRAATEQKVNKRVKKLQKRAVKGMGKKKK